MGIKLTDLNQKQIGLIDESARQELGLTTNQEGGSKALRGQERIEHELVMAYVNRHQLPCIHASCSRKVHDLPVGWPDFTFFLAGGRVRFIEIKVTGGKLSAEQIAIHDQLRALGHEVHIAGSAHEVFGLL